MKRVDFKDSDEKITDGMAESLPIFHRKVKTEAARFMVYPRRIQIRDGDNMGFHHALNSIGKNGIIE